MSQAIAPLLLGHGSPMNAIADNSFTRFLGSYAKASEIPRAIVVISAHWQTRGTWITGSQLPGQIYDFYGFPEELYRVTYAPEGSPGTARLFEEAGLGIRVDGERGIDHAAWTIVRHLYPEGAVPLLELSLDIDKTEQEHLELGRKLAAFREQGILLIGSGNVVHNLRAIDFDEKATPFTWAAEADAWIAGKIAEGDIASLVDYRKAFSDWRRPIPTAEHYLPLLYILGMRGNGETVRTIYEEIQNGSISMRSIAITGQP